MKTLIVFYSRTGTTAKVAGKLKEKFEADMHEIKCSKYALGTMGYVQAGKDATLKKICQIEGPGIDIAGYDLVLIGTPVWGWNVCPPIRSFCRGNKGKFKKVAFFCTMGGSGHAKAFQSMQDEGSVTPVATMALMTKEVVSGGATDSINDFISNIK